MLVARLLGRSLGRNRRGLILLGVLCRLDLGGCGCCRRLRLGLLGNLGRFARCLWRFFLDRLAWPGAGRWHPRCGLLRGVDLGRDFLLPGGSWGNTRCWLLAECLLFDW